MSFVLHEKWKVEVESDFKAEYTIWWRKVTFEKEHNYVSKPVSSSYFKHAKTRNTLIGPVFYLKVTMSC